MSGFGERLKRFCFAEEVPRWFGLCVVGIYLTGLGGVAYFALRDGREDLVRAYRSATEHSVSLLADSLAGIDPTQTADLQRSLRRFTAHQPVLDLQVVGKDGHILASIDSSQIGSIHPTPPNGSLFPRRVEMLDAPPNSYRIAACIYRAPIGGKVSDRRSFVEMVAPADPPESSALGSYATPLAIVLASCGLLFVIYRRLRQQMRGVKRIADRLESNATCLESSLAALRVADEADNLAQNWNRLIELVETLQTEVRRSKATAELSSILAQNAGGAICEALNAVPDGVLFLVDSGRIEFANASAQRLMSLKIGEGERPGVDVLPHEGVGGSCAEVIREALSDDGTFESSSRLVETEDHLSFYRVRVLPLKGDRSAGDCVVMITDVSQQVRSDRARDEFVSQVTHELRTPLTNIRAYAETLASGMFEDPKIVTECYNVIMKETRRLSRLIEDMLSASQMEVGSIQLRMDDVDMKVMLTEAVRDVRGLAEEKDIDLRLALPAKLELIRADRDKMAVVLNNLLGNAIKYTPSGGNVIVGCQITGQEAVVTIKDNGIGIAPEEQQRVFEKFQRGDDEAVQNETGTGVGLYTAREICRRHGGDIDLISAKGEGSTLIVRIPHEPTRASV